MPILCVNISPELKTFILDKRNAQKFLFLDSMEELYHFTKDNPLCSAIIETPFFNEKIENQLTNLNVCFICETLPQILKLKRTHDEKKSFFYADKDLFIHQYDYILKKLEKTTEVEFDWLKDIPDHLFQDYYNSSFKKLEAINDLIVQIKLTAYESFYLDLKDICHKISGGAGIYGHMEASNLCKEIEIKLNHKDYQAINFHDFFKKLYLYLQ